MKDANVLGRRYFYPLISEFSTYRNLPSAGVDNLPVATHIANSVICLPMHHELSNEDVERVLNLVVR
jgi:dTDP-4-amino-4,6-dideoxygalactose transaminase